MMRGVAATIAVLMLSGATLAQTSYPQENSREDRACRGDAQRFCKNDIPDQFRVGSCLQAHRERLSRACRAVLEGHGM